MRCVLLDLAKVRATCEADFAAFCSSFRYVLDYLLYHLRPYGIHSVVEPVIPDDGQRENKSSAMASSAGAPADNQLTKGIERN